MGSLDSILVKKGLAQNKVVTTLDDEPVGLRVKYVGTGTVTSVTITTATNVVMISSDGGTETFTFATYTNFGLLADAINASAYWECKVLDGLRTDETGNSDFVTGALTITSAGYYDMLVDTSVAQTTGNEFSISYRITYDRGVGGDAVKGSHTVKLLDVNYNVNVSDAEAAAFRIYEIDKGTGAATLVYAIPTVDATATQVEFASGNTTLDAKVGNDLLVRVSDGTSITDASANYLICAYTRE